ncbi:MAG: GAF domain-containing protein [Anaerolineales bacterium]|nr:GAF domain-containing protein [Anaerolineales bacterium]
MPYENKWFCIRRVLSKGCKEMNRSNFTFRQLRNFSLRTKMIIVFITTVVASVGTVAYLTNLSLRASLTAEIINNQTVLANSLASQVGQLVQSEFEKLHELALTQTVQDRAELASQASPYSEDVATIEQLNQTWRAAVAANNEADPLVAGVLFDNLAPELHKFQKIFPQNADILLTDKWGFNIASTSLTSNFYQADALWWRIAHADGQYISQPIYNPTTRTIALDIAVPVYSGGSDEFVGILHTTVNFNILTNLLINSLIGETGYAVIYQPTDRYLRLQVNENGNYETLHEFATVDLIAIEESNNIETEFLLNGVNVLASSAPVKSYNNISQGIDVVEKLNWRVIVLQEKNEALQPVEIQTRNILLWTLAIASVAGIAATSLARTLSGPIIRLNAVAEKLAAGDLSVQANVETNDETGTLAATFNNMVNQLRDLISSLEQRVVERTAQLEESSAQIQKRASQLEAIAEVASSVASLQDVDELLPYITHTISKRFGFYHAGIFLLSDDKEYAVLRAANSEGGQKMLDRNHKLRIGQEGIVGYSIDQRRAHIALDVGEDATYFNNPDLPATRSEIALPLVIGRDVIGVLDVQSDQPNAFSSDDIDVLSTLANQVAIAIENARLFEQSQRAFKELEKNLQRYIQNEWGQYSTISSIKGYRAKASGLEPIKDSLQENGKKTKNSSIHKEPIKLRGVTIGNLDVDLGKQPKEYTQEEIDIIQSTAERVAMALEGARLLETSQRQAAKEQQISEITAKIGASVNMRNVLQTAVEELGKSIPGSEIVIQFQSNQAKSREEQA